MMTNRCGYEENTMTGGGAASTGVAAAGEIMRMESVVCPKPRRLGFVHPSIHDPIRPSKFHHPTIQFTEICDSSTELLDFILSKGSYGSERSTNQVASSPPFFCGSPPSRAPNPLVQDARFINERVPPLSPVPILTTSPRKGGSIRVKFGHKPAPVRIEGFDCLSRDSCHCGISAVA
ncbi:hypothetical protein RJ641_009580 [Dillenia turbinata]|uniref:Uncharacterized protein n=1 Tax=Dillenia turbinata TaxID=194707 RepID=A0AAN8V2A4_9MAGN